MTAISSHDRRVIGTWLLVGWVGFALLPWNAIDGSGVFGLGWLHRFPTETTASSGLLQATVFGRLWLLPFAFILTLPALAVVSPAPARPILLTAGVLGLCGLLAVACAIGLRGWNWPFLAEWFGPLPRRNPGLGLGAFVVAVSCLMFACHGLALGGWVKGDAFIAGAIGLVVALVGLFVVYPICRLFLTAVVDGDGNLSLAALAARAGATRIWGARGVLANTLFLGLTTATSAVLLGLSMVLVMARTRSRLRPVLSVFSILPMITPPFVIGLALILLFGRAGAVNALLEWGFGIEPSRWIYGFPGVWLAQTLALTPVAFLVISGVVDGLSPSLEEAALTMRASPWTVFHRVTLPLLAPGLANAFILCFIESLAEVGNPLLLGGNLEVLSTAIYFAVVGVRQDTGRAAVLAIVLLACMIAMFYLQRALLARRAFTTITGKGEYGQRAPLPRRVAWPALGVACAWVALTAAVYGMILFGGFVEKWGLNHAFTLRHYTGAFAVGFDGGALSWTGSAWNSFWTTLSIAAVSAPLTATLGLTIAYLLDRQQFSGRGAFEFLTMLTFAVPGTVVGIAYILAFNRPPIELAYTGIILVLCFVFRDMTTSIRSGLATLAQIDRSLDEAALTLRAGAFSAVRRVVLPLMRPAIVTALAVSFISAMTSISAVIFLVSPRYDMATVNIVGQAEVGEYGYAAAYASVLIVMMLSVVILIRLLVGKRRLGHRESIEIARQGT
jgi:iron(III) transport system permease protein